MSKTINPVPGKKRFYQSLSDNELINEIGHQELIVDDLISFAKEIGKREEPEHEEFQDGIFFAYLRYKQLTEELISRVRENKHAN